MTRDTAGTTAGGCMHTRLVRAMGWGVGGAKGASLEYSVGRYSGSPALGVWPDSGLGGSLMFGWVSKSLGHLWLLLARGVPMMVPDVDLSLPRLPCGTLVGCCGSGGLVAGTSVAIVGWRFVPSLPSAQPPPRLGVVVGLLLHG
jgi:hypothetical protein